MTSDTPILGLLKAYEWDNESPLPEEDSAVRIVLKSGYTYERVTIFLPNSSPGVVRVHDLNDKGRRCYILHSEIAAIDGDYDG